MRVFIAGATGVIGSRLVAKLLHRGHQVAGTASTPTKLADLSAAGAQAIHMDGLDRASVFAAVAAARPDVIVNEMTALARVKNYKNFDAEFQITNRLRKDGSSYLLAAALEHGVKRMVVQSFAGWPLQAAGRPANSEVVPFERCVPANMQQTQDAIRHMERLIASSHDLEGVVLRYGYLYGLHTALGPHGDLVNAIRKRAFPVIGRGAAVWSFVHVDDAAEATRIAIERAPAGIYNIVDDQPTAVAEWLPELARILRARPPLHIPAWLGRLFVGSSGVYLMNRARGADNAKARDTLRWAPAFPDWRIGFARTLARDEPLEHPQAC